jgi:hypothetical protein
MMKTVNFASVNYYLQHATESALLAHWASEDSKSYHERVMREYFLKAAELLGFDVILQPKPSHPATQVGSDDRTIEQDMEGGR